MYKFLATARKLPLRQIFLRAKYVCRGRVITLHPRGPALGRVLISYTTLPFLDTREVTMGGHSNRWECRQIANTFLERGYIVDVINPYNTSFKPKHRYNFCIDVEYALDRLAPLLNEDCVRIFYATAAHWLFWNMAEDSRLLDIQRRRGATIMPKRPAPPTRAPDVAHVLSSLCGEFPESTYHFLGKPIHYIPVSSSHMYPRPEKNFDAVRKQFIWFAGPGAVRKGLDIALEAFAGMPEYTLIVCGKYGGEQDFCDVFKKELQDTPNIKAVGAMDPESDEFKAILNSSLGIVYPSSAEGCATSVLLTMHAGLIPIVSKETGVGTGEFGIMLKDCSIETVRDAVRSLAVEPAEQLKRRANATWEYVRSRHTRENFARHYSSFVDMLEQTNGKR